MSDGFEMTIWHDIRTRLPEIGRFVLVWEKRSDEKNAYTVATYETYPSGSYFLCGPYVLYDVKYWMELPKAPGVKDREVKDA